MIRVAIDGPAGVGKSSTSKALAKYYGFAYLDTGAMYRACAWWCMNKGIDLDAETIDEQLVTETVGEFFTEGHFDISVDPDDSKVYADGEDISDVIRSSEVSSHVSKVSNIIPVRHVLIAAQRAYIAREAASDSFSEGAGVVAEGRDITTVVAPDAEVRVLLTAREEVRQARRSGQSTDGVGSENVAARDAADSKVTNFTSAAEGVLTVDNSDLNFGETLDVLVRIVDDAIEEQQYRQYASNLDDYELDEGDEGLIDGSSFVGGERRSGPKPVGVLAVVGRPNVGKSTLVNRILGRRAAVVEDTPGVTRDRVSYDAEWAGTDFKLVDTGGWEADVEGIESAIASQAQIAVQLADAVVLVVDGQVGLTNTDERIVKMLRASGKPVTLAVNKVDDRESEYLTAEFWKMGLGEPYGISAMHGRGIGELLDAALVTDYLHLYQMTAVELGRTIMQDILDTTKIPAACGVGTNLYLAKVALDIMAKHETDRIAYLDEARYREKLWKHKPLTDFWRVGRGTVERLSNMGICTMEEIAHARESLLYKSFGIDAELLIDHAWGREPVTIADIKAYRPKNTSFSSGQVLPRDYEYEEGVLVVKEMADLLCLDLVDQGLVTSHISLVIGYSNQKCFEPAKGSTTLRSATSSNRRLLSYVEQLYRRIVRPGAYIRRITLTYTGVMAEDYQQFDLFSNPEETEKDVKAQRAAISIKQRYGKNAILKGMNLEESATTIERNGQIGGHKSGV